MDRILCFRIFMDMREVAEVPEALTAATILQTACDQVRRFGEAKTNVVDIARALGTSHTTIYRHFRSKAEIFDALVSEAMRDEETLAKSFVEEKKPASVRLKELIMALHRRKRERFTNDPEVYQLYRRIVEERPDLVQSYATAMTKLIADILQQGITHGEYKIDNVGAAAEVVRDAVTVFVHPVHVEAASAAGHSMEQSLLRVMLVLNEAFRSGITF